MDDVEPDTMYLDEFGDPVDGRTALSGAARGGHEVQRSRSGTTHILTKEIRYRSKGVEGSRGLYPSAQTLTNIRRPEMMDMKDSRHKTNGCVKALQFI
jgi:hypothetical protein